MTFSFSLNSSSRSSLIRMNPSKDIRCSSVLSLCMLSIRFISRLMSFTLSARYWEDQGQKRAYFRFVSKELHVSPLKLWKQQALKRLVRVCYLDDKYPARGLLAGGLPAPLEVELVLEERTYGAVLTPYFLSLYFPKLNSALELGFCLPFWGWLGQGLVNAYERDTNLINIFKFFKKMLCHQIWAGLRTCRNSKK